MKRLRYLFIALGGITLAINSHATDHQSKKILELQPSVYPSHCLVEGLGLDLQNLYAMHPELIIKSSNGELLGIDCTVLISILLDLLPQDNKMNLTRAPTLKDQIKYEQLARMIDCMIE